MCATQRTDELTKNIQHPAISGTELTYFDFHGAGFAVIVFLVLKE